MSWWMFKKICAVIILNVFFLSVSRDTNKNKVTN